MVFPEISRHAHLLFSIPCPGGIEEECIAELPPPAAGAGTDCIFSSALRSLPGREEGMPLTATGANCLHPIHRFYDEIKPNSEIEELHCSINCAPVHGFPRLSSRKRGFWGGRLPSQGGSDCPLGPLSGDSRRKPDPERLCSIKNVHRLCL